MPSVPVKPTPKPAPKPVVQPAPKPTPKLLIHPPMEPVEIDKAKAQAQADINRQRELDKPNMQQAHDKARAQNMLSKPAPKPVVERAPPTPRMEPVEIDKAKAKAQADLNRPRMSNDAYMQQTADAAKAAAAEAQAPKPGTDKLPQASLTPAQQNAMASQLGLSPSNPNMGMPKSNPNGTQKPMPMGKPGMASPTPPGMKRGGAVRSKPQTKFASGGSVGSASRRGDGIAQRGKTKGRMC